MKIISLGYTDISNNLSKWEGVPFKNISNVQEADLVTLNFLIPFVRVELHFVGLAELQEPALAHRSGYLGRVFKKARCTS